MEVKAGKINRTHFRLDVEKQAMEVDIVLQDGTLLKGVLKDISNGGIAFLLHDAVPYSLANKKVLATFNVQDRLFSFEMKIIRKFSENNVSYYAGEFIISSKIKQSQLSLLLMKLKLMAQTI